MIRFMRLFPAALLVGGVFAVQPLSPAPVASAASTITATYKIGSIETEAPPMGCVTNCPSVKTVTPAYTAQSSLGSTLSDATVVRTLQGWNGSSYTDSAGCAIVTGGGLKCWGDNSSGQLGDGTQTSSLTTPVTAVQSGSPLTGVTDVSISSRTTCIVISGAAKCVGSGFEDPSNASSNINKTEWTTVQPSGVSQVIVGGTWGNYLNTPACVLTTEGKLRCGNIRSQSGWTEATYSGITDIELLNITNTGMNVCIAGAQSLCLTFDSGVFTVSTTLTNLTTSDAVYVQREMNQALCYYSGDTMFCGPTSSGEVKMTAVGVMEKPKSIFTTTSGMSKLYFVLSNGIVYTDGWYFNCSGCVSPSTSIQVSAIGAFTASTSSSYNFAQSILASTNSPNIIPMSVETGSRNTRTLAPIKVVTANGTPLSGTSIKWTAPDVPGTLGSSASSTLTSDADGAARSTLATGPVTFTLTGGTASNGAILQAASITVIVAASGTTTVTVPDAPAIISRTVTVLNADATPVPNATVALRNTFLTYAYQGSGAGTSTWASQARDTKGYFGQVTCVYCYVAAPSYMTGTNGSVTFRSFTPGSRSGTWDAAVTYDDGDLNQTVNANFAGASSSVSMPFMAKVEVAAADEDPATSTVEVPLDSSGTATVEVSLVDEAGTPVEGFTAAAEDVCSEMESGGLASSTTKVTSVCGSVVATSVAGTTNAGPVSASGVRSAACSSVSSATTGKNGKAVFTFCSTSSKKFRIRGKGALASRTICVVVKGQPCGATTVSYQPGASSGTKTAVPVKTAKKGTTVAARRFLAPSKGATATYRASGTCKMRGTAVVMSKKSGWCALYMTQRKKTKVKGKWTVVKSQKVVRIRIT
ncbi:MAG: hypothetical protein ACO36A_01230 [Ilumatobacteraceae bacterium]